MMVRNLPHTKKTAADGFLKPPAHGSGLSDKTRALAVHTHSETSEFTKEIQVSVVSSGKGPERSVLTKDYEHTMSRDAVLYPRKAGGSPATSSILKQAAQLLKQSKSGIAKIEAKSPVCLRAPLVGVGNLKVSPRVPTGTNATAVGSFHGGKPLRDQRPSKNSINSDLATSEAWKTVEEFDRPKDSVEQDSKPTSHLPRRMEPKDIILPVMGVRKEPHHDRNTRSSLNKNSKAGKPKVPEKKDLASKQSDIMRSASVKSLTNLKEITRYFMLPKSSAGWNREAKFESVLTERRGKSPASHTLQDQSAATYLEDEQNVSRPPHQPKKKQNSSKQQSKLIGSSSWAKLLRNSSDSPLHAAFKNMMQKLDKTRNSPDPGSLADTRRAAGKMSLLAAEGSSVQLGPESLIVSTKLEKSAHEVQNSRKMNVLDIIESTIQRLMDRKSHPQIPKSNRSQSIQENTQKKLEDRLGIKLARNGQVRQSNDPNYTGYNFLYSQRLDSLKGQRKPEKKEGLQNKISQPKLYKESSRQSGGGETSKNGAGAVPTTSSSQAYGNKATPIQALIGRLAGYTQNNMSTGRMNSLTAKGPRNGSESKSIFNAVSARESMQKPVLSLTSRAPRQASVKDGLPWQLLSGKNGDQKNGVQHKEASTMVNKSPNWGSTLMTKVKSAELQGSSQEAKAEDSDRPTAGDSNKKLLKKKLGLMIPDTTDHLVSEPAVTGNSQFQAQVEAGLCPKPLSTSRAQPHVSLSLLEGDATSENGELATLKPFSDLLRNKPSGAFDKFRGLNVSLGDSLVPHPETKIKNHKKFEFSGLMKQRAEGTLSVSEEAEPIGPLTGAESTP